MIELNSKIKEALIEIDFIKRYEEVSNKFNAERTPSKSRLVYIDGEEVMEIIQDLGYSPLFDSKEKFYKIREEQVERFTLGVHIILQGGMVDLVWVVRENGELLLGAPWGTYSRRLIDSSYRIKKPIFGTYEDLEQRTIKENQTIPAGTIIDRYGSQWGKYTSPAGVPYEQRALPYIENPNAYHKYEVLKPIDNVTISEIAPAFEQVGGGIQYELPNNIKKLKELDYIKEIK